MKLSAQVILLSTALVAVANVESVEASDRTFVRNGRPERKRNLIKVPEATQNSRSVAETEADEMVEIEDAELARSLMAMSMSMSMSMPSGTAEDSTDGSPSGSAEDSTDSSPGETEESSDETESGEPGSTTDEPDSSSPIDTSDGGTEDSSTPGTPSSEEVDTGVDAPSADAEGEEESSSSSRSVAIAAVATTAMVVPLLL